MPNWIEAELETVDLGDERLNDRMGIVLQRMFESPNLSVKAACCGCAEMMAAYRFCHNKRTDVEAIFQPHRDATLLRMQAHKRVLVIQDTTELDYTQKRHMTGRGPLSSLDRQGFFAHNHLVVTPDRLALGVWWSEITARDASEHGKGKDRKKKPIEAKESYRWLQGYREACRMAELAKDTQIIGCMDREADIYEIYDEWLTRKNAGHTVADWLIRSKHDRCVKAPDDGPDDPQTSLFSQVEEGPLLGTLTVHVPYKEQYKKKKGGNRVKVIRSARTAKLEVRTEQLTLQAPYRSDRTLTPVTITVVLAKEVAPPQGEEPIRWILLSSLPGKTFEDATSILQLYQARWEIEVFHRVLKTGCRVEELQLKTDKATKVAVALYMIVAWRVMYIMRLGRTCPDRPCDLLFETDEWQALWQIEKGPAGLKQKPTLGEFVRTVAKYGGFLGRKGDGDPGPQAIWIGLTRLKDFTLTWQMFRKHYAEEVQLLQAAITAD